MNIGHLYKAALPYILTLSICASEKFNHLVAVAECERSALIAYGLYRPTYVIDPNEHEIVSGRTFTELRENAHRNNIPLILRPIRITYPNRSSLIKLIDVVEILKASHMCLCTNFSSAQEIDDSFFKALYICLPHAQPLYAFGYHCIWPSHNVGYTSYLYPCVDKQGKQLIYSDVSCALAMVFSNNYTQLLPLLHCFKKAHEKSAAAIFWNNTYNQLSQQKKLTLQQIFISQFSRDTHR